MQEQHSEIAKFLIEHDSKACDIADSTSTTPLMLACAAGWSEIVTLLLNANVDTTVRDANNKSALEHAMSNNHHDLGSLLARALSEKAAPSLSDSRSSTPVLHEPELPDTHDLKELPGDGAAAAKNAFSRAMSECSSDDIVAPASRLVRKNSSSSVLLRPRRRSSIKKTIDDSGELTVELLHRSGSTATLDNMKRESTIFSESITDLLNSNESLATGDELAAIDIVPEEPRSPDHPASEVEQVSQDLDAAADVETASPQVESSGPPAEVSKGKQETVEIDVTKQDAVSDKAETCTVATVVDEPEAAAAAPEQVNVSLGQSGQAVEEPQRSVSPAEVVVEEAVAPASVETAAVKTDAPTLNLQEQIAPATLFNSKAGYAALDMLSGVSDPSLRIPDLDAVERAVSVPEVQSADTESVAESTASAPTVMVSAKAPAKQKRGSASAPAPAPASAPVSAAASTVASASVSATASVAVSRASTPAPDDIEAELAGFRTPTKPARVARIPSSPFLSLQALENDNDKRPPGSPRRLISYADSPKLDEMHKIRRAKAMESWQKVRACR